MSDRFAKRIRRVSERPQMPEAAVDSRPGWDPINLLLRFHHVDRADVEQVERAAQ